VKEEKGILAENINIGGNFFLIKIKAPYISKNSIPGNFVMVAVSCSNDPLLKRPLGIFNSEPPFIYLYYETVGKGTNLLSKKQKNDEIDLIGPLGNGFPIPPKNEKIILIGGGRGIAPLFYALNKLRSNNLIYTIYGASDKNSHNFTDKIEVLNPGKNFFYTDDGSAFSKGFVTSEIDKIVRDTNADIIFSCGPHGMLKSLSKISSRLKLKNHTSLESKMGCGFGICHSCVVKDSAGNYKKVCIDGPVFDSEEIDWEALK
jgi:dihydroorotate dehydrogenase electron transfer subunit